MCNRKMCNHYFVNFIVRLKLNSIKLRYSMRDLQLIVREAVTLILIVILGHGYK